MASIIARPPVAALERNDNVAANACRPRFRCAQARLRSACSLLVLRLRALLDDLLAALALAVLEVAALADDERAFVVREQRDRTAVVLLHRRLVETEVTQYPAECAGQVFHREHLVGRTCRQHRAID